jgi:DNA ligase (NAD+)
MGSLDKASSDNCEPEFDAWHKRDGGKGNPLHLSEKIDGCTVVAIYKAGKLATLATRGNGTIGSNITANAPHYKNIPRILPVKGDFVLRGEAGIRLSDFEKHGEGFKNPRNATSGKLNDTKVDALKRQVTVWWFDIVETNIDDDLSTWTKTFDYLKNDLGLPTPQAKAVTVKQMWKIYHKYADGARAKLDYWIDGLVIRVLNRQKHDALGVQGKKPKGSIALKFPAKGYSTTLRDVEVDRGLQCRFTPVAILDAVEIDGTTIRRASLHNFDLIDKLQLQIGDEVEIIKGGDIIPKIVRKISNGKKRTPIIPPTECDSCQSNLVRNGAYLECNNSDCGGRAYGDMMKWIRKVDIKGIGPSRLQEMVDDGIDDVAKMYSATRSDLIEAVSSESIGSKIFRSVQGKKKLPLSVFLGALNISTLGETAGKWFSDEFETLDAVLAATETDFRNVDGIAETAPDIVQGLKEKSSIISQLRKLVDIQNKTAPATKGSAPLSGKSFCITGKLTSGKKKQEVYDWIKLHGGEIKSGVTKDLTHLITADPDSTSSKAEKARKYGTKLITEEQLTEMVPEDVRQATEEPTVTHRSLF